MRDVWQWIIILFNTSVWLMISTILALLASAVTSFSKGKPVYVWGLVGIAVLAFLTTNFLAWRVAHRSELQAQQQLIAKQAELDHERDTRGRIDLLYPWFRYAYGLEGYDGATDDPGNRERVVRRPIPTMK